MAAEHQNLEHLGLKEEYTFLLKAGCSELKNDIMFICDIM